MLMNICNGAILYNKSNTWSCCCVIYRIELSKYVYHHYNLYTHPYIALNRFVAVCRPYAAARLCTLVRVKQQITLVTIFSAVYNVPRYFEVGYLARSNLSLVVWCSRG